MAQETDFERLAILIEGNTKAYENAMKKLQGSTDKAIRAAQKSVSSLDKRMADLGRRASQVAGIFGIGLGAQALGRFITNSIEAGSKIGVLATRLGITAEALQQYSYAAAQSGTSQEAFTTALTRQAAFLGEAERGSKGNIAELKALGLTLDDLKGKDPGQVFETLADRIGAIEDPIQRSAVLIKFFGRSGAELNELMSLGSSGIKKLREEASSLGLVLSNETIAKMKEAGDKVDRIKIAMQAAGISMAEQFVPALEALERLVTSPGFQNALKQIAGTIGSIVKFLAENPKLAGAAAGALAGLALTRSPVGAGIGAILGGATVGAGQITSGAGGLEELPSTNVTWAPGMKPPGYRFGGGGYKPPVDDDPKAAQAADRIKDVVKALQLQYDNLYRTDREQEIYNELARAQVDVTSAAGQKIAALAGNLFDAKQAQEALNSAMELFGSTAYNSLEGLLTQTMTVNDALGNLLQTLAKAAFQAMLLGQGPLAGLFGTASGTSGNMGGLFGTLASALIPRAGGGRVHPGNAYKVGERGEEVFIPDTTGQIRKPGFAGGGSQAPVFNISVDGARGNSEIREMVAEGVNAGLRENHKAQARAGQLSR